MLIGHARLAHKLVHAAVLAGATHHTHVVHVVLKRPYAALGIEHVPAREHAHVIGRIGLDGTELVEVPTRKHDATRIGKAALAHVRGIVIDHAHVEADVRGKRGDLA